MPKKIVIPDTELWDDETERFITLPSITLVVEHSLVSISKWESKWHKPFLTTAMTREEMLDYIQFMTLSPKLDNEFYLKLPVPIIMEIQEYINDPMTATWFTDKRQTPGSNMKKEVITSELVYYWMLKCGIPFECEKWHFNRLMTLIRVFNVKESAGDKSNKMTKAEILRHNRELNAKRRGGA